MNAERLLAHYEKIADAPDAIARLPRFVLDLAVRGKLVPQDPNDEPASELLNRIAAEKARLVKAGEIKTPKETPALGELPFELPTGWRWSQIAEIGLLSPRNEESNDQEVAFLPMPLIPAGYGAAHGQEVRPWGEIKKGYTHFANGDVGLAKITPCFENGKSTVFRNLTGGIGAGTTELHIVRPVFVDANYILIFLKSPHFIETGIPRMTGTAGQKRVPFEYFAYSPFPLPPLAEQHRIVAKVDELMALCDRLEAARQTRESARDRLTAASLARLSAPDPETFADDANFALDALPALTARADQIKQLRKTILNLAVRGKLVPQSPKDEPALELLKRVPSLPKPARYEKRSPELIPGDCGLSINDPATQLPNGWLWVPLVQIARLESGHTPSRNRPEWWGGDVPWIGLVDARLHNNGTIFKTIQTTNENGLANSAARLLPKGTVCFSRTASVGYVVIMGRPMATSQDFVNWVPTDAISSLWLQLVMIAERPAIGRFSKGAVHQTIYYPAWLSMHIALPPLAEQHRIVARANELMALCDRLEASLTTADETRRRLLEALLAGALAPSDARELAAAE